MDPLHTLILGVTPPAMAILAELGNPIQRRIIENQASGARGIARQLARRQQIETPRREGAVPEDIANAILVETTNPVARQIVEAHLSAARERLNGYAESAKSADDDFNQDVLAISKTIAGVSAGAVRVAGLIPTWISVTAGLAAILVEVIPDTHIVFGIVSAWITIWSFLGIRFFAVVDYYATAYLAGSPEARRWRWVPTFIRKRTKEQLITWAIITINALVIVASVAWFCSVQLSSAQERPTRPENPRSDFLISGLSPRVSYGDDASRFTVSSKDAIQDLKEPIILISRARPQSSSPVLPPRSRRRS